MDDLSLAVIWEKGEGEGESVGLAFLLCIVVNVIWPEWTASLPPFVEPLLNIFNVFRI